MDTISKTIYVEQFPLDTSEDTLREIFSSFGKIDRLDLPCFPAEHPLCHGHQRPKTKGYAFLEFQQKSDADQAFNFFNDLENILSLNRLPQEIGDDTNRDPLRDKIIHKSEYRNLMPLRVMMKQNYLSIERNYEDQRLKSLIKSAKLLVVTCPNLYGGS